MPTFVRTFIGASVLLLMTVQGANAQTLTLESALQTAFANNPDMAAAQWEIDPTFDLRCEAYNDSRQPAKSFPSFSSTCS